MAVCDHGDCKNPATQWFDTTTLSPHDAANKHEPTGQFLKEPKGQRDHIHHLVCAEHTDWRTHEPAYGQARPDPELDERLEHGPEPIIPCGWCGRPSASWRVFPADHVDEDGKPDNPSGVDACLGCLGHLDEKGRYTNG